MKKNSVVFLPVPENLRELFSDGEQNEFTINPYIPIPVEIQEDCETVSMESLSIESILYGMLRVIEERQVEQEWIDYYSNFVLFLKPDILEMIKEITDNGLTDDSYLNAHNLLKEGKAQEGLNCIRDFLERYPLVYNGWFILGWALRLLGRWEDAAAALRKAIELGGDNSDTRNELAICLMEMGGIAEAKRELEAALFNDPENVKIISNLGALALKTGDKEKAAAFFRTALEIDSSDPVAKKFLEQL